MEDIVKVCKKHGNLTFDQVSRNGYNKGVQYYKCKICKADLSKKYRKENKEKLNTKKSIWQKKYFKNMTEDQKKIHREKCKQYYHLNPEKYKEKREKREKRKPYYTMYVALNREILLKKKREHGKIYYQKNKKNRNIQTKEWAKNNKEKVTKNKRRYRQDLADCYIKTLICDGSKILKSKNIPKEFIEAKRIYIKFKRKLKEMKNGNK